MSLKARLESLRSKHAQLEAKLHTEESRPLSDQDAISEIKREKLLLKEEIQRLEQA